MQGLGWVWLEASSDLARLCLEQVGARLGLEDKRLEYRDGYGPISRQKGMEMNMGTTMTGLKV